MEKNSSHFKIIMGDFNTKIGKYLQGDDEVMGPFGYGEQNERGTRLVQFAVTNSKYVTKIHTSRRKIIKVCMESPEWNSK